MNILFTICGRAGSKGVKGKNLKEFCDAPLVWYSLAAISLYKDRYLNAIDSMDVVINTDSDELVDLAKSQPALDIIALKREEELAGDRASKVAVIRSSLIQAENLLNKTYDVVVDLDITSPLRTVENVHDAILRKISRDDTDAVFSVTESRRNPYFNMVREEDGYFVKAIASSYTARQQAPVFYDMNASIYVYDPKRLKEKDTSVFFNDRCDIIIMKDTGILDIDSEEDYELIQVIGGHLINRFEEYAEIRNRTLSWIKRED